MKRCVRGLSLGEFLEQRSRYETPSSGHWVVGIIPEALVVDVSNDMEKIALLKRELVWTLGAVL